METNLSIINKEIALTNPALSSMRERIIPLYEKGAAEIGKYADKAAAIVQRYNRAVAMELAALPVSDKGKLDDDKFDGFKSPAEIAMKVYGFGRQTAYDLVNAGRTYLNEALPEPMRKQSVSNLAALQGAKQSDVVAAFKDGTLTADSSQRELQEFTKAHRKTETKTGKAKVVIQYNVYRGPAMEKAPGGPQVEEEFKAQFDEMLKDGAELHKMKSYILEPQDAPGKKLTCLRYVYVNTSLEAAVFTLIPVYEVPTDKPAHVVQADEWETSMVNRFIASHPDASREDALETLKELGMI